MQEWLCRNRHRYARLTVVFYWVSCFQKNIRFELTNIAPDRYNDSGIVFPDNAIDSCVKSFYSNPWCICDYANVPRPTNASGEGKKDKEASEKISNRNKRISRIHGNGWRSVRSVHGFPSFYHKKIRCIAIISEALGTRRSIAGGC